MKKIFHSRIFQFSSALFFACAIFVIALSFFSPSANSATTSKDAIAIRVLPNTNHYSPLRWYKEQGFSGSPQSMLVDGYEAVRDGRTVYVGVANVAGTKLYTNIYLISYNQAAESATIDIFGKILAHWKFNTNVTTVGNCSLETEKACLSDDDCASDEHCDSAKAKIIRDTKRLSDLAELQTAIENYFSQYDYYPKLTSGTYLANKSISTWPSWNAALGAELGITIPVDPINKLGDCGGDNYNATTCWDAGSKKFAGSVSDNGLTLPAGSNAYVYSAAADGSSYGLTMGTEAGSLNADGSYSYDGGGGGTAGGGGGATTSKSVFTEDNIEDGYSGKAFSAILEAENPNEATLIWKVTKIIYQHDAGSETKTWTYASGNPGVDSNGVSAVDFLKSGACLWDGPELLALTGVDKQRKIIAQKMGKAGTYVFSVSLDENNGTLPTVKDFSFTIKNDSPIVFNVIALKNITIGHNLDYIVAQATDDIKYNHYPMAFSIFTTEAGAPEFVCKQNPAVSCEQAADKVNCGSELDGGVYQCRIEKTSVAADTKEYTYTIIASDYYGEQTQSSFKVKVENNPPDVNSISLDNTDAIAGCPYTANVLATDYAADGHTITEWLPGNLATNFSGATINAGTGAVSWPSASAGTHTFEATVRDQYYSYTKSPYSAETKKTLSVNAVSLAQSDIPNIAIYDYPLDIINTSGNRCDAICVFYLNNQTYQGDSLQFGYTADANIPQNRPSYGIDYTLSGQPSWLGITKETGVMQGTPTNASSDGTKSVTVTAKDSCNNVSAKSFSLTVERNRWCGDQLVNGGAETCDYGAKNNGTTKVQDAGAADSKSSQYACGANCAWTGGYCGDGTTQTTYGENCDSASGNASTCDPGYKTAGPHSCSYCAPDTCLSGKVWGKYCGDGSVTDSEQCEAGGTGSSATDQYGCTSCAWSGGYKGDGIINGGEQCDGTNLNSQTCLTQGFDFGTLSCKSDGTLETSACGTHGSQTFTSSGTFTVPNAVTAVTVTLVGGGGGGGGGNGHGYGQGHGAGGGGGGGVLENQSVSGLTSGASIAVTVGAGGAGGGNDSDGNGDPNNSYGDPGGAGGSSSFGSYITAYGGGGGGRAEYGNSAPAAGGTAGGSGGTAGGAGGKYEAVMNNNCSDDFCYNTYYYGASGAGGNSMNGSSIGGAGLSRVLYGTRDYATSADNGNSGTGYGAGGSGATSEHFSGGIGGSGNSGYVTITW